MSRSALFVAAALVALCNVSCEDRPGDRALRDLAVGRATAGELAVTVVDGLAAVHAADVDSITLWVSAPTFSLRVRSEAESPRTWRVTLRNSMPDGALVADAAGAVVDLEAAKGTTQRYAVTLPPGESGLSFRVPDDDDRAPYRFALLSDVQEGIDEVGDVFAAINAQPDLRFVLGAGDLADRGSREELEIFQAAMADLRLPYYTTLGNHDVDSESSWHDLFGRGSFRFVYRGVQFTLIDSAAATVDSLTYDWLDGWLREGRDRVHVVVMHVPPLDPVGSRNGAFGDRNEAGMLLSRLARGHVDLTLYGHIHSFYQYENASIPAFISGGGGADDEKLDGYGRHFMVIELGADEGLVDNEVIFVD